MKTNFRWTCLASATLLVVAALAEEPLRLADPFVLVDRGRFYAYGTSEAKKGIKVAVSDDLVHWRLGEGRAKDGFAMHLSTACAPSPFWAPEVYRRPDGKYVMHVSCGLRIRAALADSPLGPFVSPTGKPVIEFPKPDKPTEWQGTIDSSLFVDNDGKAYLFFVRWNPDEQIWRLELEGDWMTAKPGTAKFVFATRRDSWETVGGWLNEGPFCVKENGLYYLTYSAGDFKSPDYAVGAAVATSIDGPWKKPEAPFMRRSYGEEGTGHHSFFRDRDGRWRIVFHAHEKPGFVGVRKMLIADAAFAGGDCPTVKLGSTAIACEVESDKYGVCVVGGGVAGLSAALSAGRRSVRTLLIEQGSQIGGNMTSGGVTWPGLFHAGSRQVIDGCGWELVTNCVALAGGKLPEFAQDVGAEHWRRQIRVNAPLFVALTEEALQKAGVNIRYHTAPVRAAWDGKRWSLRLSGGGAESTAVADVLVDATGNGALAALCGGRRMREATCQPGGFTYLIDPHARVEDLDLPKLERMREQAIAEGRLEKNDICRGIGFLVRESNVTLDNFPAGPDHGTTIANYIDDADNSTAELRTKTNLRGRASMLRTYRFLRTLPGLERAELKTMSQEVGVRETWRVVGEHVLTGEDYVFGRVFPDSVCHSFYPIDLHDSEKGVSPRHIAPGVVPTVPLRSLIVKGCRNLLVAGRCVSSDRKANSALRVQASCMATGQVAGEAAALASATGQEVRELDLKSLKERIKQAGGIVP